MIFFFYTKIIQGHVTQTWENWPVKVLEERTVFEKLPFSELDFKGLQAVGSMLGSAGVVVLNA